MISEKSGDELRKVFVVFFGSLFLIVFAVFFILGRFSMTGNVGYTSLGDVNLTVADSIDEDTAYPNETVYFVANYTNDSVFVNGASCNISFADGNNLSMSENNTYQYYIYNRTFDLKGNWMYNVTCSADGLVKLEAQDDYEILGFDLAIVADHSVVDLYERIPDYWIDEVKKMWVSIPGENHSLAYRNGTLLLEALDSDYNVSVVEDGIPEVYQNKSLRISRATWGDNDTATGWIYGYGEEDWFTNDAAVNQTKDFLNYSHCNDSVANLSALGFGWGYDMTFSALSETVDPYYGTRWAGTSVAGPDGNLMWGLDSDDSQHTSNSISMQTYINVTEEYIDFIEDNGINTTIFFTTGPVDGNAISEYGYQRYLKHEYIRKWVDSVNETRYLFDYADILTWDNDSYQHIDTWDGHNFPQITDSNLGDESLGYIGEDGALRLGKAMWWFAARMAGWNGTLEAIVYPVISSVSDSDTNQTANVTFNTNIACNATILYGINSSDLNLTSSNSSFVISHHHYLVNLYNDTRYYYNITACDENGYCDYLDSIESFRTGGCVENWNCTAWSDSANDCGTRDCDDLNSCGTTDDKPDEDEICSTPSSSAPSSGATPSSNTTALATITQTSYIEEKSSGNKLSLYVNITNWEDASLMIADSKDTGVKRIKIDSNGSLLGSLVISETSNDDLCDLDEFENYKLYKTLLLEHSFPEENITFVEAEFYVDPSWIDDNDVDDLFVFRCESGEALGMKLVDLQDSTYSVESRGFSTWMILGVKNQNKEKTSSTLDSITNLSRQQIIFIGGGLGGVVLIIVGIIVFFRLRSLGIISSKEDKLRKKGEKVMSEKIDQIARGKIPVAGTKVVQPKLAPTDKVDLLKIKDPSLRSYVKQCLDLGIPKIQIIEELKRSGWPEDYLSF